MPKSKDSPASGIPAKGAGKVTKAGDGWGGPARGAGTGGPARAFTKKDAAAFMFTPEKQPDMSPEAVKARREVKAEREDRIEQLTMHLADLGLNAEREETQVSATIAALNRLEGMPKQKNENLNVAATWEQLVEASLKPKA